MRELVVENQEVLMIPQDFKLVCKGKVTAVTAGDFTLELYKEPQGIMVNTFCEFYTQTPHGKLYFDSYAKEINGKTLTIASPAKHKFLQRRQYTRIKYLNNFDISYNNHTVNISTLDISAGGMKFSANESIDIDGNYPISIPVSENVSVNCIFKPIRIEKPSSGNYLISGEFSYNTTKDKMMLTQYCAKRSYEIKNK